MLKARFLFPPNFLWGTATAAHQVEGGNTNNNWSAWEEQPGRILQGHRSGRACDWWAGRWKDDLDRAADTGQNAHRMSIEWSRVQPAMDRWDEDAVDHYRQILRGMHERGLKPFVTLHHFTDPLWLTEMGGWENPQAPTLFEAFVRKVVGSCREYVETWVTINEPNIYVTGGYLGMGFPPGKNDPSAAFQVMANLVRGHSRAYHAIHALQQGALVGFAQNYRSFKPQRPWLVLDTVPADLLSRQINDAFPRALVTGKLNFLFRRASIPEAAGTQDFLGVNYYTRDLVRFNLFNPGQFFTRRFFPPEAPLSDTGFLAHVPEGMFEALNWARSFGLPIYVTENGVENAGDGLRPRYIIEHIHQIWRAVNFNWPVRGYFHWSLLDNFEWERGWTQRFGLWGLDVETQTRIRRSSADLYSEICHQNAITSEMISKYTPGIFQKLMPGGRD
jgi:beta-glucosidase